MEKKMPTSTTNEFGKHPSKKVITELLENQQRKEQACSGFMENISKLRGEILPLTETISWIDINKETRTYFTGRIDEELGSYIITINSNNP